MTARGWRYASASALGTSHATGESPCQDACLCDVVEDERGDEVLLAVVADGAGSAPLSHLGAQAACRTTLEGLKGQLALGRRVETLSRDVVAGLVEAARGELRALADGHGVGPRELACTLLAAAVGPDAAAFFQIGDGVVVVAPRGDDDGFSWVFWPERGEYANSTAFLSDASALDHLVHDMVPGAVDEVALLTDGLQALVLDYKGRVAHAPFFHRMMAPLRGAAAGPSAALSRALAAYLNSPRVNERTDDDKTLVLASRRPQP